MTGPDIQLMFRPAATYRMLLQQPHDATILTVLRRPLLIGAVIGGGVVIAATGTATFGSVLPMMAWWSFAPLIQLLAAAALVATARGSIVPNARAIDLLLAGHAPWSLWILLTTGLLGGGVFSETVQRVLYASILVVLGWRAWLLYHFCRSVLNDRPRRALGRVALHQGAIWLFIFSYVCYAVAFDARF